MMPIGGRRFDYQYGGLGFMLARGSYKGRAWSRTGRADTPSQRSAVDARFGVLPDALDHPEVWDDWTGGFGHAYRRTGEPTYHWAENFDARFPRQLVHCQAPQSMGTLYLNVERIAIVPPVTTPSYGDGVWAQSIRSSRLVAFQSKLYFTTVELSANGALVDKSNGAYSANYIGKPTLTPSGMLWPHIQPDGAPKVMRLRVNSGGALVASFYDLPYVTMVRGSDRTWIAIGGSGNLRPAVQSIAGDQTQTANLSATLMVGPEPWAINDMAMIEDQLCVSTPQGLFVGDQTGTFVNVAPQLEQAPHADNLRDLMPFAGGLLGQTVQGLWHYGSDGFTARVQDIAINAGRSAVAGGYVRALGQCGPWIYAGRWTGSETFLLASADLPTPSPRWHTLQKWPGQCVSRMFFDGITDLSGSQPIPQRQYVAMTSDIGASGPLYYWQVPTMDGNPLIPAPAFSANYIGSARIDLGNVDWGAPGTPKVYRAVEVWADTLLSGYRYADVYYDVDQSGSFTPLGRAQISPKTTLYFSSGEGSFVTGQSIELSLRSFTASPAFSPVYRSLVLRGALQPRSVDMITAVTRIADGIRDRQGAEMRSGAVMLQELRDFASPDANGVQAHQLIDLAGATQWAKIIGPVEEQEVYNQGEEYPEVAATVKFAVLTFS